jgi:Domain of unknown function (DUF4388)
MQTPRPKLTSLKRESPITLSVKKGEADPSALGLSERNEGSASASGRGTSPVTSEHGSAGPNSERSGFTGTCSNTSLADWIQLVQMGRRDAVLRVRAHGGREGLLWCRAGDIIDAACDGLVGEEAVYRALSWAGGEVSVDFRGFDHPRRIQGVTASLLLESALRNDMRTVELSPASDAPMAVPGVGADSLRAERQFKTSAPPRRRSGLAVFALLGASVLCVALLAGLAGERSSSTHGSASQATVVPAALPVVAPAVSSAALEPSLLATPASPPTLAVVALQNAASSPPVVPSAERTRPGPTWQASQAFDANRLPTAVDKTARAVALKPRVQVLEERAPRVRLIDDTEPKIKVLE